MIGRVAFAAIFVVAGIAHFAATESFERAVPPSLPYPRAIVLISGVIEVVLGFMLLIPTTARLAAWGLIALLVAVFPANIHVYRHQELLPFPPLVHLLRLPLQAALIYWAYQYTTSRPAPN